MKGLAKRRAHQLPADGDPLLDVLLEVVALAASGGGSLCATDVRDALGVGEGEAVALLEAMADAFDLYFESNGDGSEPYVTSPGDGRSFPILRPSDTERQPLLQLLGEAARSGPRGAARLVASMLDGPEAPAAMPPLVFIGTPPLCPPARHMAILEMAVAAKEGKRWLDVTYCHKGSGVQERISYQVLALCAVFSTGAWYLAGWRSDCPCTAKAVTLLRLDRCLEARLGPSLPQERSRVVCTEREVFGNAWAVERGEDFEVEIRFADVGNVLRRVDLETRHRPRRKIKKEEGFFIYQDIVASENEFAAWVRQFGYAAEVIKPAWLRERLIETARAVLQLHEAGRAAALVPGEGDELEEPSIEW